MKNVLKISTILSWFNIIVWGFIVLAALLMALFAHALPVIILAFFLSVIILNNYASLQLHRSIRNPSVPLGNQTPVGIRFLGFAALFFGVTYIAEGITLMQNTREILVALKDQTAQFPSLKDVKAGHVQAMGVVLLIIGLTVAVNVFLNFRLLRWYLWLQSQDKDQGRANN